MGTEVQYVGDFAKHHRTTANSVVVVHSAFRGLGAHGAAPERFCRALLDWVGKGTLLMPAMTWRTVTPAQPMFDELTTPGHTGVLAEVFRNTAATARSLHPTHSVAGCGPLAKALLSTHHLGTTPCAANSPYGLARDYDFWSVMIGVGLECCTAIHHCEEVMEPDIYLVPPEASEAYTLVDRDGKLHAMTLRRHARKLRDFPGLLGGLEEGSDFWSGSTFSVPWTLVNLRPLFRHVFSGLVKTPSMTLSAG